MAEVLSDSTLVVRLEVPKGWHINSNRPLQQGLIATELGLIEGVKGWGLEAVRYPPAETVRLGFQSELLSLYHETVNIHARFKDTGAGGRILPLELKLQACNDEVCLPPERVQLRLPAHK